MWCCHSSVNGNHSVVVRTASGDVREGAVLYHWSTSNCCEEEIKAALCISLQWTTWVPRVQLWREDWRLHHVQTQGSVLCSYVRPGTVLYYYYYYYYYLEQFCTTDRPQTVVKKKSKLHCASACSGQLECREYNFDETTEDCSLYKHKALFYEARLGCFRYKARSAFTVMIKLSDVRVYRCSPGNRPPSWILSKVIFDGCVYLPTVGWLTCDADWVRRFICLPETSISMHRCMHIQYAYIHYVLSRYQLIVFRCHPVQQTSYMSRPDASNPSTYYIHVLLCTIII